MNNKFTVIVLLGDKEKIKDFKRTNKNILSGNNIVNLTHKDSLKDQIEFIIEDEALSRTKDTIVVELTEYYPETIDEIVNDIHEFDVKIKFLMVVEADNMSANDHAVYDRIAEVLGVTDAEIEKAQYITNAEPSGYLKFPNNVISNITNLNQLIDSMRFYYGIQDSESMPDAEIPQDMRTLIESSFNLIASRIVKDIKNIDE